MKRFPGSLGNRRETQVVGLLILLIIHHRGGKTDTARLLDELKEILKPFFEAEDLDPASRHDVRAMSILRKKRSQWVIEELRRDNYLLSVEKGGRGILVLSDDGTKRVKTLLSAGRDPESHIPLNELTENINIPFLRGQAILPVPPEESVLTPSRRGRTPRETVPEYGSDSRQCQILAEEIAHIRDFLNGNGALRPDDQTLCDWIWFCYKFELFIEGTTLFRLIHPESVEHWLYEHTRKLAEVCNLRK